jgi:hypothetical protein
MDSLLGGIKGDGSERKVTSRAVGFGSVRGQRCADCATEPEPYVVDDELWRSAGARFDDGLCLACLTRRIGRPLQQGDFVYGFRAEL